MPEETEQNTPAGDFSKLIFLIHLPEATVAACTDDAEALFFPEDSEEKARTLVDLSPAEIREELENALRDLAEASLPQSSCALPQLSLLTREGSQDFEAAIRALDEPSHDPRQAKDRALVVLRPIRQLAPALSGKQPGGFYSWLLDQPDSEDSSASDPVPTLDRIPPVIPFVLHPEGRLLPGDGPLHLLQDYSLPLEKTAFLLHDLSAPPGAPPPELPVSQRHFLLLPHAPQTVLNKIHSRMQQHLDLPAADARPVEEIIEDFHIRVEINPFPVLQKALDEHRAFFHFQPVLRLPDRSIERFEALIRLKDAVTGGVLKPFQFIPPAEQHPHLIRQVDFFVLRQSALLLRRYPRLVLNINVSGCSLGSEHFFGHARQIFQETGFTEFSRLGVEITETAQIRCASAAAGNLNELRNLGIRIFLDDYGSSFSSASYLRDFPIDVVKVDGSFTRELFRNPRCEKIVRNMIASAHECGCEVVAEWIDQEELAQACTDLGYDYAQGFYLGEPRPLEDYRDHPFFQ